MKVISFDTMYGFKNKLFSVLFLDKIFKKLADLGLKPNHITIISIFCGVFSAPQLIFNHTLYIWFFLTHMILDNFDGYLARSTNQQSKLGDELDHVGDISIGVLILLFSFPFANNFLLSAFIIWHIFEYLILRKFNLLQYKFPTRYYAFFFIFKLFNLGIIVSIVVELLVSTYVFISRKTEIYATIKKAL